MRASLFTVLRGLPVVALGFMTSCSSLDVGMITGKPSYNPATFGTEALKERIKSPEFPVRDGVAAAKELANRTLSDKDAKDMLALLAASRDSEISVALLATMKTKQMSRLKQDLIAVQSKMTDPEAAVQCAITVCGFIEEDAELIAYLAKLLKDNPHANVRARSARLLASYGSQVEDMFIAALAKETSASAATVMCETLQKCGTAKSFAILEKVANDVSRVYASDAYLGRKATAETVRATAVATVEAMKAAGTTK